MDYIKEINAFYNWLMYNSLSTGAIALWHALMSINNRAGWTDEFTVANIVLQGITGLSRQGLHKARNLLIQKGLIEYKKGTSNQAGKYKLNSLVYQKRDIAVDTENTDCKKVDTLAYTVVDTEGYTEVDTENFECKKVGTEVDTENLECKKVDTKGAHQYTQKGHSSSHSSSTLYKQNKTILNNNKNIYIHTKEKGQNQSIEENHKEVKEVFDHWNEKDIIRHRRLTGNILLAISTALNDYTVAEICQAIDNYATILADEQYYFSYRWSLNEFLERGLDKFLDLDTAIKNYTKIDNNPKSAVANSDGLVKTVDFNRYEQHDYNEEELERLFEPIGKGYF